MNQRRRGGQHAGNNRRAAQAVNADDQPFRFDDDEPNQSKTWYVGRRWFDTAHFETQSELFEDWFQAVNVPANSHMVIRAERRIVIVKTTRREQSIDRRFPPETREIPFQIGGIRRLDRGNKLKTMIGLLAFDGNYPSLRDAETYKEIESEIGKARKFRVSELTVTIKSSENQNANLRLVAYGQGNKKGNQAGKFSSQFDNPSKSNMPMFESVRLFAELNRCKCMPGRAVDSCKGFLFCPLDFQHPIQTLHDLVCKDKYLCVGLAMSCVFYTVHKDRDMLLGLPYAAKQTLAQITKHDVLPKEYFDAMTLQQKTGYEKSIDELMIWTQSKNLHIYEVVIQSGIERVNTMFQDSGMNCIVHLLDVFKETVIILRQIQQTQDSKPDSVKRQIGRHISNNLQGAPSAIPKKNFYLVYYLSHAMMLTKDQTIRLLQKFAGDFINAKLRPFMLLPNLSPQSLFSRVTTISNANLEKVKNSHQIDSAMCNWFDGTKIQEVQVSALVMKDQELKGSIAIMQSEHDEVNLKHIQQIRQNNFDTFGLAAFDIETCMETDPNNLRFGSGNQIPIVLSLKGSLYDYKNNKIVQVSKIFTNYNNFGQPFADVCYQFVKFLIDGNHFSESTGTNRNYIFAHNGCKFDFLFIIQWLILNEKTTHVRMIGSPDKLKAMICQGIYFYDSYLLISKSLNQMAKSFLGREKIQIEIADIKKEQLASTEFTEPQQDGKSKLQLIEEYCLLDSELLYLCMQKFFEAQYLVPMKVVQDDVMFYVYNQKAFHMTASSMALSLFTTCFLKYPVGCAPRLLQIERDTYAGGFTCNLLGRCSFGVSYDINSSYAAQMLAYMPITHKDPDNIKTWDFEINGSVKYDKQFNEHDLYHVSYDIVLDQVSANIVRSKNKMGLIELQKQDNVWMWGVQIKQLMLLLKSQPTERYLKIHEVIQYEPRAIYKEYIQTIYKQRTDNSSNQVLNALYKMLLCGLYGKHGQKDMKSQQMFTSIQDAIDYVNLAKCYMNQTKDEQLRKQNMWLYVVRQANDSKVVGEELKFIESEQPLIYGVEVMESAQQHIGSLVRIASFISAKARVHLISSYSQVVDQLANKLQVSPQEMSKWFQLVYCDTDSLYIDTHKLMARLIECNIPSNQMTQQLREFIDMTDNGSFVQYTGLKSKSEQGLAELKDLYVVVAKASNIFKLLDDMKISDPGDTTKTIKFIDSQVLGSFKLEKLILAAAFAAPKQYSTYYFENLTSIEVQNDVKIKGVRANARNQNPQLIFDQVDVALQLFKHLQLQGLSDLTSAIIDNATIQRIVANLFVQQQHIIDGSIMVFNNLVQFRGHKTGVTIYKLSKYISFVLSKRHLVVSQNSQCLESKPHMNDKSYETQRLNLLQLTKALRQHKKTLMHQTQSVVHYDVDAQQCSLSVKRNNCITQEYQAIVEEHTKQPYWFYDQTLVLNSCVTMLDKIQSSTNRSFNYNRQSLPINLQLVERYVKLVKNTERLKVLFNQSYQDFCQIHKSIDEQVLIEAFNNDILKGFMDQSTPQQILIDVYSKLMLLNMCLANRIWRHGEMINKQDDALFDKFNKIFKQQKDKAFSKTCMTECMINFNLSVIFKVTMFQYTCRMIQTALELDSIDMNKEELNCAQIKEAWQYERNHITGKRNLDQRHIDIFLSMTPICDGAMLDYSPDVESSESE